MARQFRKDDIEFHGTNMGYHPAPAVNVKVRFPFGREAESLARTVAIESGADEREAAAFAEWALDSPTDDDPYDHDAPVNAEWLFNSACEWQFEYVEAQAPEIFGRNVKLYTTGRSGGWLYVDEFRADDVEQWNAIDVSKWGRFARLAREAADDVPRQMLDSLFFNEWPDARAKLDADDVSAGLAPIGQEG